MAQIKFFRGNRDLFFSGAEGAFDAASYSDAVCFSNDTHEIIVNGVEYGMSETLKGYLEAGKILTNVEQNGLKVTLSFSNADPIEIDFSAEVATSDKNGLMSAEDKVRVETLSEALIDSNGEIIVATKDNAGLMTAAQAEFLLSLEEGSDDTDSILSRMSTAEANILTLQGEMDDVEASVKAIEEEIGDWSAATNTIAEAIGGLDGRVVTLEDQIQGLSGAMHFKGVAESDPTKLSAEALASYENGDVVIFGEKEYVFSGKTEEAAGSFVEFGDVSAEGDRISALEGAVEALQGKDTEIEGSISALAERVTKNEDNITAVTTQAGENKSAIEALAGRVDALEEDTTDADAIAALAAKVGDGFSEESTVADAIASLVSRMDAVDTEGTGSIAVLAARVQAIEDDQTCENAIADHEARIATVEDQLVWHDAVAPQPQA